MNESRSAYEEEAGQSVPDPDELPIRDRKVITAPYDLVAESLVEQIKSGTIFLRPLSERPRYQRRYVWTDALASRLIESIILNVPIPPCYLSQNDDYELDVIDGQQRLYSLYRYLENQFSLKDLEVIKELNGLRFFELPTKIQRQLKTHTFRCVLVTNESHPEIKFDVFERLNTNTVPLNAQELRNCIYRGSLNALLGNLSEGKDWLRILGRKEADNRLRDEEVILRFFAFDQQGLASYKTPQKHWLNDAAKAGRRYSDEKIKSLEETWNRAISSSLVWFDPKECFRRPGSRAVNKALFDLIANFSKNFSVAQAAACRDEFRALYAELMDDEDFSDLIGRSVDHTTRTRRRFEVWAATFNHLLPA